MKTKFALCLFLAAALPACTSVHTTSTANMDAKNYASMAGAQPPAEGPVADIPAEGPHDVNANPAYMPSPLLRQMAAGGP
jgi:hypothetical protein